MDFSKINLNGQEYNVKDEKARNDLLNLYVSNINELKQINTLNSGDIVKTLGYYEVNDGGTSLYQIRYKKETDVEDGGAIHFLQNELVAELIIENNTINVRQLGARSQSINNDKYDLKPYINMYIDLIKKNETLIKLYIPSGVWYCSETNIELENKGFMIIGDTNFEEGTIITSLNDNQNYVLKLGSETNYIRGFRLENLTLSSANFKYSASSKKFVVDTIKHINNQVLNMIYCTFGYINRIDFININGQALYITSSWEIDFGIMSFRGVSSIENGIFKFGTKNSSLLEYPNITNCSFLKLGFESVHGDLMVFDTACEFYNNHIYNVTVEPGRLAMNNASYTDFNDSNLSTFENTNPIHNAIFNVLGSLAGCTIDSIELQNYPNSYYTINNVNYVYDTIYKVSHSYFNIATINNSICTSGGKKNIKIIDQKAEYIPYNQSRIVLNSAITDTNKDYILDVNAFPKIECSNTINSFSNPNNEYLPNNYTPAYKNINHLTFAGRGLLYYDQDSINKLKLVVKPYKSNEGMRLLAASNKLMIRAKIPEGENVSLWVQSPDRTSGSATTLTGTGVYQYYEINLDSRILVGDKITIAITGSSQSENLFVDYYGFI